MTSRAMHRQHPTTSPLRRLPDIRRVLAVALLGAVALICAGGSFAAPAPAKMRVTVIGDSITASLDFVPSARRYLGKGFDLHSDAVVCRRLVAASCAFQGSTPATALQVVGRQARTLGPVVVINVGYNDWAAVYDVDRIMRALKAAGVHRVVWVTLREAGAYAAVYRQSNARIRSAASRWRKSIAIADWNHYSSGKQWFGADELHLTSSGALGLARLLRPLVVASASA